MTRIKPPTRLITICLFGVLKQRYTIRQRYVYILDHWLDWFPKLLSYQDFHYRLNQVGWQFEVMIHERVHQV
jgi:hypothetical protein